MKKKTNLIEGEVGNDTEVAVRQKKKNVLYSLLGWGISFGFVLSVILVSVAFVLSYIWGRERREENIARSVLEDVKLTLTDTALDRGFGLYFLDKSIESEETESTSREDEAYESEEQSEEETEPESMKEEESTKTEEESGGSDGESESAPEENTEGGSESTDPPPSAPSDDPKTMNVVISDITQGLYGVRLINKSSYVPDIDRLASEGFVYDGDPIDTRPIILVVHAHTCEEYSRDGKFVNISTDGNRNPNGRFTVAAVGERLTEGLCERGIPTVHCTVIHDKNSSLDSYSEMKKSIELMLQMYPTVRYVIDVHRLSEMNGEGEAKRILVPGKPDGEEVAQIRLETAFAQKGGTLSKEEKDRTDDALRLTLSLQARMNGELPYLCGPIVLRDLDMSIKGVTYIGANIGGLGNTVEDATRASDRLAEALADILL